MNRNKKTLSCDEIELFLALAQRFYNDLSFCEDSIFLDIGANIGTTSIYVKKMKPSIHVIGFEIGKNNYDLFRINCILNQMDSIRVENLGLSDKRGEVVYRYVKHNSGGSGIVGKDCSGEPAMTISLDEYVLKKSIDPDRIGYIWIDTEGHEANIIHGAMDVLKKRRIPMWQEFNPVTYQRLGVWERYKQDMEMVYEHFIDRREWINDEIIHSVSELDKHAETMGENNCKQTDLFWF